MKTLRTLAILLLSILTIANTKGSVITVVADGGDWMIASTWDLNRIPQTGDYVNIPAGKTVQVSTNAYHSVPAYPLLGISVYGVLQFVGTGQLNIECESFVCTKGAGIIPSTGCNCNQITMGVGLAPWKGDQPSVLGGNCVVSGCASALPVELLTFDASIKDKKVELLWTTQTEVNFDHFEVERSSNGTKFESIGVVYPEGKQEYNFTDLQTPKLVSYYRLKMVDIDNLVKYSSILEVQNTMSVLFTVYPNPSSDGTVNLNLLEGNTSENCKVLMTNALGAAIEVSISELDNSTISIHYPAELSSGIYSITYSDAYQSQTERIVVR